MRRAPGDAVHGLLPEPPRSPAGAAPADTGGGPDARPVRLPSVARSATSPLQSRSRAGPKSRSPHPLARCSVTRSSATQARPALSSAAWITRSSSSRSSEPWTAITRTHHVYQTPTCTHHRLGAGSECTDGSVRPAEMSVCGVSRSRRCGDGRWPTGGPATHQQPPCPARCIPQTECPRPSRPSSSRSRPTTAVSISCRPGSGS